MDTGTQERGRVVVADERAFPQSVAPVSKTVIGSTYTQHLAVGGLLSSPSFTVQAAAGMISPSESYFEAWIPVALQSNSSSAPPAQFPPDTRIPHGHPRMLFGDTLWYQCDTYLNNEKVSDDFNQAYPWASFARYAVTEPAESGASSCHVGLRGGYETDPGAAYPFSATGADQLGQPVVVARVIDPALRTLGRFVAETEASGLSKHLVLANRLGRENSRNTSNVAATPTIQTGSPVTGAQMSLYMTMYSGTDQQPAMSFKWKPNDGFWNIESFIPASTDLRIELQHSSAAISFMNNLAADGSEVGGGYLVPDFSTAVFKLWIKRYQLSESARAQLSSMMTESPLLYPMLRSRVALISIPAGDLTVSASSILQGQRGNFLVAMCLRSSCMRGTSATDRSIGPWGLSGARGFTNQQPGGATDICSLGWQSAYVTWGGETIPAIPFSTASGIPSDTSRFSQRCYEQYSELCGGSPLLSYSQWAFNYTLVCFDLSRTSTGAAGYAPGAEEGSGSLSFFATFTPDNATTGAVPHTLILVMFGSATLSIYKNGQVRRLGM